MIFVCVGSRDYPFDRLIIEIDRLAKEGLISEKVYAQIGASNYIPKYIKFSRYLSQEEFVEKQDQAKLIVTHGGTGAIVTALKKEKQVIAVPRLAKYKEHIDDHQIQVSNELAGQGYIKCVIEIENLKDEINNLQNNPINKKFITNSKIPKLINDYIKTTHSKGVI